MLSQLVYFSNRGELGPGGILRLVDRARIKNAASGVTGVILFNRDYFLQCLEGERREVTETFGWILPDPRHTNVELMSVRDIEQRDFPDWTMGLLTPTGAMTTTFRRFLPTDDFPPQALTGESATALLKSLRDVQYTV